MKKKDTIVKYYSDNTKQTLNGYILENYFNSKMELAERSCVRDSEEGDSVYTYKVTFELIKTGKIKTIVE